MPSLCLETRDNPALEERGRPRPAWDVHPPRPKSHAVPSTRTLTRQHSPLAKHLSIKPGLTAVSVERAQVRLLTNKPASPAQSVPERQTSRFAPKICQRLHSLSISCTAPFPSGSTEPNSLHVKRLHSIPKHSTSSLDRSRTTTKKTLPTSLLLLALKASTPKDQGTDSLPSGSTKQPCDVW